MVLSVLIHNQTNYIQNGGFEIPIIRANDFQVINTSANAG